MCGIFGYFIINPGSNQYDYSNDTEIYKQSNLIKYRGPDKCSHVQKYVDPFYFQLAFQRLNVVGGENGDQPFTSDVGMCVCNGEIYNYQELIEKYSLEMKTKSDCEVILKLYKLFECDISKVIKELDGVFAFCLFDTISRKIYLARDPYGVRPLFYGTSQNTTPNLQPYNEEGQKGKFIDFAFGSEAKTLEYLNPQPILPGKIYTFSLHGEEHSILNLDITPYFDINEFVCNDEENINEDEIRNTFKEKLELAVIKRIKQFHSKGNESELGFLLSGGVDSSIVLAIAVKWFSEQGWDDVKYPLNVFSIGDLNESPDLKAATHVVEFLNEKYNYNGKDIIKHHIVEFNPFVALYNISNVIYQLESYDITTVRASIPMYLLSKYIKQNTNVKVIMSGEGSDELLGGYLYFHYSPSPKEFEDECKRLLSELYLYDNLRADRSTAAWGLEVRVPFLDLDFTTYALTIPTSLKRPTLKDENGKGGKCEKELLRKTFSSQLPITPEGDAKLSEGEYLPNSVLWRQKEAFSDAVGMTYQTLVKNIVSNMFDDSITLAEKEELYYKNSYLSVLPNIQAHVLKRWVPRWIETNGEPSATVLDIHD